MPPFRPRRPTVAPWPRRPSLPRLDLEHTEQVVFFNRIRTLALNDKRYARAVDRTFAIPNGGFRSKKAAGRMKAEGQRAGVSDIFCSVSRRGRHGLYLEMKRRSKSTTSKSQSGWISDSIEEGYDAAVCKGADEAFAVWKEYVDSN